MTGSTENQQRIVDRGCCFGRVGPAIDQQRAVDQFLLIWSPKIFKKIKNKEIKSFFHGPTISELRNAISIMLDDIVFI